MIRFIYDRNDMNRIRQSARRLGRTIEKLEDRSDIMEKMKKRQVRRWETNFNTQGSIYGRWAPLSQFTISRRTIARGITPLRDRNTLYPHFTAMNEAGEVSNDAVNWNFRNKGRDGSFGGAQNILTQHFGLRDNRGRPLGPNVPMGPVPARTLWDFNEKDEDAGEKMLDQWVTRILNQFFGG